MRNGTWGGIVNLHHPFRPWRGWQGLGEFSSFPVKIEGGRLGLSLMNSAPLVEGSSADRKKATSILREHGFGWVKNIFFQGANVEFEKVQIFANNWRSSFQLHLQYPGVDSQMKALVEHFILKKFSWHNVNDGKRRKSVERFDGSLALNLDGEILWQKRRLQGDLSLELTSIEVKKKISTKRRATVRLNRCPITSSQAFRALQLECSSPNLTVHLSKGLLFKSLGSRTLTPRMELSSVQFLTSPFFRVLGHLTLESELPYQMDVATQSNFEIGKAVQGKWSFQVRGDGRLAMREFALVRNSLQSSRFAIPAPLNKLRGPIDLQVSYDWNEKQKEFKYFLEPRLKSENQRIRFRLVGRTLVPSGRLQSDLKSPGWRSQSAIEVNISDLQLVAPRFDLRFPPRLRPDRRFGHLYSSKTKPLQLPGRSGVESKVVQDSIYLRIRSEGRQSIRVVSQLLDRPIPIELNLVYANSPLRPLIDSPLPLPRPIIRRGPASIYSKNEKEKSNWTGYVNIGEVGLQVFRRQAELKELRFSFLPNGEHKIKGVVWVQVLDYFIAINLTGSPSQPIVLFQSDPQLDEDQILSVLLFGQPLGELAESDRASVRSLRTAFTDAVLGLTSLYVLASTPIQSVGYDVDQKMLTAHIGLGEGTTLQVGSQGKALSEVSLQKRLSRELTLRSDVERIGTQGKKVVSAFIEWARWF